MAIDVTDPVSLLGEGAATLVAPDLSRALPLCVNASDETLGANIRAAMARDLPIVDMVAQHEGTALLVGGGPSLKHDIGDLKSRQAGGGKIFALNGAGHFLNANGVVPDYVVVLDARAHNARFVRDLPKGVTLYLATQCAPEVFDAGIDGGHDIITWHAPAGGLSGVVETRPSVFIVGGQNVGIRAMSLAFVLGYRDIHLYGYDSSYDGDADHAYAQPENKSDRVIEAFVDGEKFYTCPWMARQADDFREVAPKMIEAGCNLSTHGYGLLPTVARKLVANPLTVFYDLEMAPPSYDFLTTLALAEGVRREKGCDSLKVVIVPAKGQGKFTQPAYEEQMLWGVVLPLARCLPSVQDIVLCSSRGEAQEHFARAVDIYPFDYDPFMPTSVYGITVTIRGMEVGNMAHFRAPEWSAKQAKHLVGYDRVVTITLREADYATPRNSDVGIWLKAANDLKAKGWRPIFIRDTSRTFGATFHGHEVCHQASFDLAFRLALYENAAVNCFVANGPMTLALLAGSVKTLAFDLVNDDETQGITSEHWRLRGLPVGAQFPGVQDRVRVVWQKSTAELIVNEVCATGRTSPVFSYDLTKANTSFDFVTWLAICANKAQGKFGVRILAGPKEGFRDDTLPPYSIDGRRRFLFNVMLSACELFPVDSLSWGVPDAGAQPQDYAKRHIPPGPLQFGVTPPEWARTYVSGKYPAGNIITITLREGTYHTYRNSDVSMWLKVAAHLRTQGYHPVFVRDAEAAHPLPPKNDVFWESQNLALRAALYEHAILNIGTVCGAWEVAWYNPRAKYITFSVQPPLQTLDENWVRQFGLNPGKDAPWAHDGQHFIWETENFDLIVGRVDRFFSDRNIRSSRIAVVS